MDAASARRLQFYRKLVSVAGKYGRGFIVGLLLASGTAAMAASPLIVVHPAPESPGDIRDRYYWQLLDQALRITEPDFGPYMLRQAKDPMKEPRILQEIMSGSGSINVVDHPAAPEWERRLLPIRFPLDKGLLGYRVFLIRKEMQPQLSRVRNLQDLRRYRIGQGQGWVDVTILRHAGFTVIEGADYEGLFDMLASNRFDLFSRGLTEVAAELAMHKAKYPDLVIDEHLLLYYPLTSYFYVGRSPSGRALAHRISVGLERMRRNGTFERMFESFKKPLDKAVGFQGRILIRIDNPLLTPQTPLGRHDLWYNPYEKARNITRHKAARMRP
jgi:ABC-type amino acid transport substrate-binding protein